MSLFCISSIRTRQLNTLSSTLQGQATSTTLDHDGVVALEAAVVVPAVLVVAAVVPGGSDELMILEDLSARAVADRGVQSQCDEPMLVRGSRRDSSL